jgi:restriction system protein
VARRRIYRRSALVGRQAPRRNSSRQRPLSWKPHRWGTPRRRRSSGSGVVDTAIAIHRSYGWTGCLWTVWGLFAVAWLLTAVLLISSRPASGITVSTLLALPLMLPLWLLHRHRRLMRARLLASGIEDCDRMTGEQFERRVALALEAQGAHIERGRGGQRDGGADVIATMPDGTRIVIQCKRFSSPVGWSAVMEAHAARTLVKADRAVVVTNNFLNAYAMQRAAELGVEVWDRNYLINLFAKTSPRTPFTRGSTVVLPIPEGSSGRRDRR